MTASADLLQGTLDLLILRTLVREHQHSWAIGRSIHLLTKGTFDVKPGSMFPALRRLEEKGWIAASWGVSDNGRQAKFYELTSDGKRQLKHEVGNWRRVSAAINWALEGTK